VLVDLMGWDADSKWQKAYIYHHYNQVVGEAIARMFPAYEVARLGFGHTVKAGTRYWATLLKLRENHPQTY